MGSIPNAPFKIQIALQGGGAKLSVLLAAMEAVQKLHRDNIIQVTKIAGTSAGSIVACLFAADVDLALVRTRLKAYKSSDWNRYFPRSKAKAFWKLIWGQSLWSTDLLEQELKYFFSEQKVNKLQDIEDKYNITPIVIATDLSDAKPVVYRGDKPIISAIIDSCAIPYCFSVWNKSGKNVIVDGGICENFPSEELDSDEETFGAIVGISFEGISNPIPNSFQGFTYSLLNTSMNHSISRAKRNLGISKIFSIETKIDTFDFPYAFSDDSDIEYKKVKMEAESWLSQFVAKPLVNNVIEITPDEWELQSREYMTKLNNIYDSHHLPKKFKYLKTRLEVKAGCLEPNPEPDFVQYEIEFNTLDSSVYCHRIALSKSDTDSILQKVEVELYQQDTDEFVELIYVPLLTVDPKGKEQKTVLVYFIPELPPNSGPYILKCTDTIRDFVGLLRDKKPDILKITPFRAEGTIDKIEMVLHVPASFSDIEMFQKENLGAKMSVSTMSKRHFSKYPNYKSFGWEADSLPPNNSFRVELVADDI